MEEKDLMRDLRDLPRNSAIRKINELVKRVRLAKVHAYIIGHLKEQMPMLLGQTKKQQQLIADMGGVFRTVMKKYNLAPGDFPDLADFQSKVSEMDFTKFHSLRQKVIDDAESVLGADIPRLMEALPRAMANDSWDASHSTVEPSPIGYSMPPAEANPWAGEEELASDWGLAPQIPKFKPEFDSQEVGGFISGKAAKDILMASGLSVAILRKIWDLADVDKDGKLVSRTDFSRIFMSFRICTSLLLHHTSQILRLRVNLYRMNLNQSTCPLASKLVTGASSQFFELIGSSF